jgi:hypothetical protein
MKRIICLLLAVMTSCAYGQGIAYTNHVWSAATNVPLGAKAQLFSVPRATVQVCVMGSKPCIPIGIFSDAALLVPVSNPLATDTLGNFTFFAASGNYYYTAFTELGVSLGTFPFSLSSGTGGVITIINSDTYTGSDVGARVAAAQTAMGGSRAIISVNTAGTLSTAFTLAVGNDLQINAPLTLNALVTLAGTNRVVCAGNALLTVTGNQAFSSTGSGLQVTGCTATGNGTTNATLLSIAGSSHVKVAKNVLTSMGLVGANGGSDLEVIGNSVSWPSVTTGYGVVWAQTSDVRVLGNSFTNVYSAVEFFNANADFAAGGPTTRAGVLAQAGHYVISNNTCTNSLACYWGSVGHDIVMSGNYATNCSDVCYDLEGSVDSLITGNRGDTAVNGVGTTFFFSDHNSFIGNSFSSASGGSLIRIFNTSQTPSNNEYTLIKGNALSCGSVMCQGIGGDPAADLTVDGNQLTNATISLGSQHGNTQVKRNELSFNLVSPSAINAIVGPGLINSSTFEVADNTVTSVTQPAGSACISDSTGDFNSNTAIFITNNKCFSGFPIDLTTANTGTNPGVMVTTTLAGNWFSQGNVIHTHTSADLDTYTEISRYNKTAGVWSQTGSGTAGATGPAGPTGPAASLASTFLSSGCTLWSDHNCTTNLATFTGNIPNGAAGTYLPSQRLKRDVVVAYGSGMSNGVNGWLLTKYQDTALSVYSRGISQVSAFSQTCYKIGDCAGIYGYVGGRPGFSTINDEGISAASLQSHEAPPYTATIATTTGVGDTVPTFTPTGSDRNLADGATLIDTARGTISGSFTGPQVAVGSTYLYSLPVNTTLPVSTAWCTLAGPIMNRATIATTTSSITLGCPSSVIGGSSPDMVAGQPVCIAGPNQPEEAVITARSGTGATQSLTLSVRYQNGIRNTDPQNPIVFQGPLCGQYMSSDADFAFSGIRTTLPVFGSLTGTDLIFGKVVQGTLVGQLWPAPGGEAGKTSGVDAGFHLYPGAEIAAVTHAAVDAYGFNAVGDTAQLAPNHVVWTAGDTVENPAYMTRAGSALLLVDQQQSATDINAGKSLFGGNMSGDGISGNYTPLGLSNSNSATRYIFGGGKLQAPDAIIVYGPFGDLLHFQNGPTQSARGDNAIIDVNQTAKTLLGSVDNTPFNIFSGPINGSNHQGHIRYIPATGAVDFDHAVTRNSSNLCAADGTGGGVCGSAAGIANIQVVLPTASIAANFCTTSTAASMPGVQPTSAFSTAYATSPNAVNGWGANGGLKFVAVPTTDTLNWSICNGTAAAIIPGALTINVGAK